MHLKNQKFSGGYTPGPPWREGATPSRTHPQLGLRPHAGVLRTPGSAVTGWPDHSPPHLSLSTLSTGVSPRERAVQRARRPLGLGLGLVPSASAWRASGTARSRGQTCERQSCRAILPLSDRAKSLSIDLSRAKLLKVFRTPQQATLRTCA
jgi:hypothetical protein